MWLIQKKKDKKQWRRKKVMKSEIEWKKKKEYHE